MSGASIREITAADLGLYDRIPSRVLVRSEFRVEEIDGGIGGFKLFEAPVEPPYWKDYGADTQENPSSWPSRFDLSTWGIFLAELDGEPIGAAAVSRDISLYPLDRFQRADLAVLWDLRVAPEAQGRGLGTRLFQQAAVWAHARGCGQLGLETQNVNVPGCRFYAKQGCSLGAIHRLGYAGIPGVAHEVMLLWYHDL